MGLFSFLFRRTSAPPASSGARAEALAAVFLERQGLTILERNHRCRGGEVDLICRDGSTVVFVEVRLRSTKAHGGAAGSITPSKRRRLILAARHWLAGRPEMPCRFDAVLLECLDANAIEWVKNAFSTD